MGQPTIFQLRVLFFLVVAFLAVPLFAAKVDPRKVAVWQERKLFAAKNSSEATVEFDHQVEFNHTRPTKVDTLNAIDSQLAHLFGPLGEASLYAVPKGDHQISEVSRASAKPDEEGTWVATYHYRGTMQIKNGDLKNFRLTLPNNPDAIYEQSRVGKHYPCTDHHYFSLGDFWYFWNPNPKQKPGCKLKEGVHYTRVKPNKIERIPPTKRTYPDYPNLINRDNEIRIDFLMGMDEPELDKVSLNPLLSADINAETYRDMREALLKVKFEEGEVWTKKQVAEVIQLSLREIEVVPYVQEFTRETARGVTLRVRLFFGPSGIGEEGSLAFHYFYRDALEHASIMLYDGHSGLGGHLDIPSIEEEQGFKVKFSPRYQIYFFNSCSSYTYYNSAYFYHKSTRRDPAGTTQLDILTNGLATSFYVMHKTNLALILAVLGWADEKRPYRTYQDLAKTIDSANLFAVNGDEDNPKTERELK